MKTLILNNHTKHISELEILFPESTVLTREALSKGIDPNLFDLIVISGGSGVPAVLNHKNYYSLEEKLILESNVPILGICLGSEIIIDTFGGELTNISTLHKGDMTLTVTDQSLKNSLNADTIIVYEAHCVTVKKLPESFTEYASSEHGIEIFKHNSRPIIGIQFHPEVGKHDNLWKWILEELSAK